MSRIDESPSKPIAKKPKRELSNGDSSELSMSLAELIHALPVVKGRAEAAWRAVEAGELPASLKIIAELEHDFSSLRKLCTALRGEWE